MIVALRAIGAALPVAMLLLTSACAELGYYGQSVSGHLGIMARQVAIPDLLEKPGTSKKLRAELREALEIRDFASRKLGLPNNASYRSYADLKRPYVVWSVVATPEFSLRPRTWCFPFAGCVSYRGYFSRDGAEHFAAGLQNAGLDVHIAGVRAYSTLGWFSDPVLSSMLGSRPELLAGTIFHELAHQLIYVQDDSDFNEAFATAVAREGLRRWLQSRGDDIAVLEFESRLRAQAAFVELVMGVRPALRELYQSTASEDIKRLKKTRILANLGNRFQQKKAQMDALAAYSPWFAGDINNARLATVATYHQQVPAFERLLQRNAGNLAAFYGAVSALSRLPREQRWQSLEPP